MKYLTLLLAAAALAACAQTPLSQRPDAQPDTILDGPVIPGTSASDPDDDDAIIDVDPAFEDTI